ncbi:MAG TPA: dTDP-glucose 4,6-dehydratase [Steroidobacteraceae bacterium]|jgi:dTDP-glucose 4,6-dehydratase
MSFEPHNLFVTGGAGFIGSNFVHHWLAKPGAGKLVVFDALTYAGNPDNLSGLEKNPRFVFVKGDICDEATVRTLLEEHRIDTLVHFAAESHVDRSILGPDDFIRTNVVGTHALLKVAKALWVERKLVAKHRFHHVSTDEVYGSLSPADPRFHEDTPYAPNSPYSASKAGSDHLVRAYHETFGLSTTITNCSNNYGPYHFPEKLIPLTIVNILQGKPLPVYGDGLQIRDWLYVEDHCVAIALALERGLPGQVYNIGGNSETTNIEIVRGLCALLDERIAESSELRAAFAQAPASQGKRSSELITHVKDRPGHDRRYAIDCSKAARELGYAPARDLATGLRATVDWYLANRRWWQALLDKKYADWLAKNYKQ